MSDQEIKVNENIVTALLLLLRALRDPDHNDLHYAAEDAIDLLKEEFSKEYEEADKGAEYE